MKPTEVVTDFYQSFQKGDKERMVSHYHPSASFEDPAFGPLQGEDVKNMWRLLIDRGKGQLQIDYSDIREGNDEVTAHWEARYLFSQTGRQVHNKIDATFIFKDDLIIKHVDKFDFWKWSSMALGIPGILLGWSPLVKNKVRKQCLYLLNNYRTS